MGRPAASVGAAAGRVSVWRRDSGARHGFTVAKRIPATRVSGLYGGHGHLVIPTERAEREHEYAQSKSWQTTFNQQVDESREQRGCSGALLAVQSVGPGTALLTQARTPKP